MGGRRSLIPKKEEKTSKVAPAPPAHLPLPVLGFWRGEGLLGAAIMSRGGGWGHHDIMEREEKEEKRRKRRMLSFLGKKIPTRRLP